MARKGTYTDLTGMKFNMLTAVEFLRIEKKIGSIWKFKCDCGKEGLKIFNSIKAIIEEFLEECK